MFAVLNKTFSRNQNIILRTLFFSKNSTINAEYWDALKTYTSYKSPQTLGFSWVSKDKEYLALLQKHFQPIMETFDLSEEKKTDIPSIHVDVVNIDQTPYNNNFYLNQTPHESVSIGGPSALAMTYFESERYVKQNSTLMPPIFSTKNVMDSNAYGSALQVHQRYAQRMAYTDSKYEGWNLFLVGLQRLLTQQTLEQALTVDYLIVDFDWTSIINNNPLSIADICIRNECLTWQDKFNRYFNRATTGTDTYHYAQESARILRSIDNDLGGIFNQQGALSIGLSAHESQGIANKNKWLFSHHGIDSSYLTPHQLKSEHQLEPEFFPGGGAFYYAMDGHLKYDFWEKLEAAILRNRGRVERWTLKKIVLDIKKSVVGVIVEEKETERFIRTNHVYSSLGYNAQYHFNGTEEPTAFFSTSKENVEKITTATGFSGFALVLGDSPKIPIAFNSHHTTRMARAYDPQYGELSLVKTTGGALMGSNAQYQVQHAANNVWYNEKIFGADKFKLLAAKGCSRSINSGNSGKFSFFSGCVIGTGRGGKGVTDMFSDAVVAGTLLRQTEPSYREHSINISAVTNHQHIKRPFIFNQKKTTTSSDQLNTKKFNA